MVTSFNDTVHLEHLDNIDKLIVLYYGNVFLGSSLFSLLESVKILMDLFSPVVAGVGLNLGRGRGF